MYPYTENHVIEENSFLIHVRTVFGTTVWSFVVFPADTLRELKCELRHPIEADVYEMSLFPLMDGVPNPYPLRDDMPLSQLYEEHRTLIVVIGENPKKLAPRRLLTPSDDPQKKPILNLVDAAEKDLEYIAYWIVRPYSSQVRAVRIPWDHPRFCDIVQEITRSFEWVGEIDTRIGYPRHYYLVWSIDDHVVAAEVMTVQQRNALLKFFRVLSSSQGFRRVRVYADKGILGNTNEESMVLTKENLLGVDLLLAESIADYQPPQRAF
jgi:hypothetical protein